jgi:hypothetical protein
MGKKIDGEKHKWQNKESEKKVPAIDPYILLSPIFGSPFAYGLQPKACSLSPATSDTVRTAENRLTTEKEGSSWHG